MIFEGEYSCGSSGFRPLEFEVMEKGTGITPLRIKIMPQENVNTYLEKKGFHEMILKFYL